MDELIDDKQIYNLLIDSITNISELLKSAGNSVRLRILAELLLDTKSFSFFLEITKLKKTSLTHHMSSLISSGLIIRTQRGLYKISSDGIDFLKNITFTYKKSQNKSQLEQEYINEQFEWNRMPSNDLSSTEKCASSNPIYQGGWNSYISSVSGILISLGLQYNYFHIGGRSGYSFITNIQKGVNSFLAESLLSNKAWDIIQEGIETFGWNVINVRKPMNTPRTRNLVEEDLQTTQIIFNEVKNLIDKKDIPVVMWGLRVPAYGIIRGFQKENYLVSTYFRLFGKEDTLIKSDELEPLDSFHYFYFKKYSNEIESEDIDKKSLDRAINFAKGIDVARVNFVAGPEAYTEWCNTLKNFQTNNFNIFGNSFLAKFYLDAKNVCSEYLDRLSNNSQKKNVRSNLIQASKQYRKVKNYLEEFSELFPYFEQNQNILNENTIGKGISLLKKAKIDELKAIESMEAALNSWI